MNLLTPKQNEILSQHWGWFFAFGLALIALGVLAVVYSVSATLISVIFFGAVLTISGIVIMFDSFKSSWGIWNEFFLHLGMGLLYLIAGVILIKGPVMGSLTLTLILAIFYIVLGLVRTVSCLIRPIANRGWRLASSIITLILGLLILIEWPASGLFILGLFIGIDLIFTGWIYVVTALSARPAK